VFVNEYACGMALPDLSTVATRKLGIAFWIPRLDAFLRIPECIQGHGPCAPIGYIIGTGFRNALEHLFDCIYPQSKIQTPPARVRSLDPFRAQKISRKSNQFSCFSSCFCPDSGIFAAKDVILLKNTVVNACW